MKHKSDCSFSRRQNRLWAEILSWAKGLNQTGVHDSDPSKELTVKDHTRHILAAKSTLILHALIFVGFEIYPYMLSLTV